MIGTKYALRELLGPAKNCELWAVVAHASYKLFVALHMQGKCNNYTSCNLKWKLWLYLWASGYKLILHSWAASKHDTGI